jgi:nucleotide-binding universal stress UspA family protein
MATYRGALLYGVAENTIFMTRLLVGTDGAEASEIIVEYLNGCVNSDDTVFVVNSLVGGDETSSDEIAEGEDALDVLEDGLGDGVAVERHQYIRGNAPIEDLLEAGDEHDIDEYVIGIRKRSPVGKMMFGSTAQNLLLETELPVRCVPLVSD